MVYILLANGFEDIEALAACDMLRRAQIDVKLTSIYPTLAVKTSHNVNVIADISLSEINRDDIDMLVIPGGMPGTTNIDSLPQIDGLLDYCIKKDKFIAAICAGPLVLGKRSILSGKNAICYPGFEKFLYGANICSDKKVVTDGKIITAIGPGAAIDFGLELCRILAGDAIANKIKEGLC